MHKLVAALALAAFAFIAPLAHAADAQKLDPENTLYMDLKDGRVVIKLYPEIAPKTVARIKKLTREGFYNGLIFHRVIDGFMAQGGDPTGTGRGSSMYPDLPAEFTNKLSFGRGTVGMARAASPDSGNSQFFICFQDCSFLDGKYTIWGQVVSGMDHVDNIARGEPPVHPDKIIRMQVAADVKK